MAGFTGDRVDRLGVGGEGGWPICQTLSENFFVLKKCAGLVYRPGSQRYSGALF